MTVPSLCSGFPTSYHREPRSDKFLECVSTQAVCPTDKFMTKQTWTLLALAVALGVLYAARFTDLGRQQHIQINVAIRPFMPNAGPDDVLPIIFGLDRDLTITALKVTPVAELTNAKPKCVWQLTTKKTSEPVRGFAYGDKIPGMEFVAGVAPTKLLPGVPYHLEVEAGRAKGEVDFTPQAAAPAN
jgi:hypothetical protein